AFAGKSARDLAGAIGAEVEVDAGVIVADAGQRLAAVVHADERQDELVGHALVVGILHPLHRIDVGAALAFAFNHRREGFLDALPAAVAVHGVIAAFDRSDLPDAVLAHLLLELLDVAGAIGGQGVATVHEAVDEDAVHAVLL